MTTVTLTQNMRFFKAQEEKLGYERQIEQGMQDFRNEMAAFFAQQQDLATTKENVDIIEMKLFEATFALSEMSKEIACTPYRIRG